jgi:hypothetical protein
MNRRMSRHREESVNLNAVLEEAIQQNISMT